MTIISAPPVTEGDIYLAAFAAMSELLRAPGLTPVTHWEIRAAVGEPSARGQVHSAPLHAVIDDIRPYASVIIAPEWEVDRYRHTDGGALHLTGTFQGVHVDIWGGLKTADLDMAEQFVKAAA